MFVVLVFAFAMPSVAAQAQGNVDVSLEVPGSSQLDAGNSTTVVITVRLDFQAIYCQGPNEVMVNLMYDGGDATVTIAGPDAIAVPFKTGPVADSPAGGLPGIPTPAEAQANISISTRSLSEDIQRQVTVTATFPGGLPPGCQAGSPPPASQENGTHDVTVKARPATGSTTTGTSLQSSAIPEGKESPPWPGLLLGPFLLALAWGARRDQSR